MPAIFSPGEPETRPFDPDAIVYTTAQKVADLLGIGPSEAVLMSANAEANAVFVTGGDYRNIGFSNGDKILIYSDADPLGAEVEITNITSTASGVKLTILQTINPGLYETTDNGYVQNLASFTNGKSRGMKRSTVETRIKEVQDRIDNITHNAWRPYLVSAEYLNFDTYKPYRRRYFTDYVGTTPLLFRNVQQMLRIEMWQGEDYREICGAEVRIQLPDDVRALEGKFIVLSPGNGSAAKLEADVQTTNTMDAKWSVSTDKISAAQSLADLINKEDRASKAITTFQPSFYFEGAFNTLASVHQEFFASANSDYGSGQLKVTSMKQTKAGEVCSIVSDSTDINFSQVTTNTATVSAISGTFTGTLPLGANGIMTVDSISGFANAGVFTDGTNIIRYTAKESGVPVGVDNIVGGSGYSNAFSVATTGGSGTGLKVNITTSAGAVTGVTIVAGNPGSGYKDDEVITITGGGGNATFTINQVSKRFTGCANVVGTAQSSGTITQHLLQLDLQGGSSSGDQARLRDWWLDAEMGIVYFNNSYPFFEHNSVKVSYIYGERYLEKAIEEAATKMVAADLLLSDDRSVLIPEGSQNVDLGSKIQLFRKEAEELLARYKEVVVFS